MHEIWRHETLNAGAESTKFFTCSKCGLHITIDSRVAETIRRLPCDKVKQLRDDHEYDIDTDPFVNKRRAVINGVLGYYEYFGVLCTKCMHSSWKVAWYDNDGNLFAETVIVGRGIIKCSTGRMRRALE